MRWLFRLSDKGRSSRSARPHAGRTREKRYTWHLSCVEKYGEGISSGDGRHRRAAAVGADRRGLEGQRLHVAHDPVDERARLIDDHLALLVEASPCDSCRPGSPRRRSHQAPFAGRSRC